MVRPRRHTDRGPAAGARGESRASERAQRHAGLDARHHVLGHVLRDGVEAREIEHEVEPARRAAEAEARSASARRHREALCGREREHAAHFIFRAPRARRREEQRRRSARPRAAAPSASTCSRPDDICERLMEAGAETAIALTRPRSRSGDAGRPGETPRRRRDATARACPGFMMPSGSKQRRSRAMKLRSASRVLQRHARALSRPTPCSPVTLPPMAQARLQQLLVDLLRPLHLAGHPVVVEDHRVQVAVAGVEDVGDPEPVARADGLHLAHDRAGASTAARRRPARASCCSCVRRRRRPPCAPSTRARARPRPAPRGSRARRDHGRSARCARPAPRPPRAARPSSIRSTAPAPFG